MQLARKHFESQTVDRLAQRNVGALTVALEKTNTARKSLESFLIGKTKIAQLWARGRMSIQCIDQLRPSCSRELRYLKTSWEAVSFFFLNWA